MIPHPDTHLLPATLTLSLGAPDRDPATPHPHEQTITVTITLDDTPTLQAWLTAHGLDASGLG